MGDLVRSRLVSVAWRSAVTAGRSLRAREVVMAGYPVQRGHPPTITWEAARCRARDSGTLSGTSAEEEQMTGKIMPLRERDTSTIQAAADAFLSSPRYANPNASASRRYARLFGRGPAAAAAVHNWAFCQPWVLRRSLVSLRVRAGCHREAPAPRLRPRDPCSHGILGRATRARKARTGQDRTGQATFAGPVSARRPGRGRRG